uniref:phosphotransferase n=1 Tax=Leptospira interrogans TaxID=173 RepID=UPI0007736227
MNDAELKKTLENYLSERLKGKTEIHSMVSLSGGACQENFSAQVQVLEGPEKGSYDTVFRTDKGASLLASLSRENEFRVCEFAYNSGVNTPRPFWLETDLKITGSPFYFMQKISGKATGRYIVKDPSLNRIRKQLAVDLAENLAKIHSLKPKDCNSQTLRKTLWMGQDPNDKIIANGSIYSLRLELEKMP